MASSTCREGFVHERSLGALDRDGRVVYIAEPMVDDLPSHDVLTAKGARPERLVMFLHGILGRGRNWHGLARRLVRERPEWGAVLVDLRAHGASRHLPPPDTLESAAADLMRLRAAIDTPVTAVLGHSFGGKVALTLVREQPEGLEQLFVVDSLPGARPDGRGSEGALDVVDMLARLPARFASRREFVEHVSSYGYSPALAEWLAQSLDPVDGGYRFGLDMSRIEALLDDYFAHDLWPAIDPPPGDVTAHLIIAGRSSVYRPADRERARELSRRRPNRVRVHVLENADHWVHVDDPEGLMAIVEEAL